MITKITMKVRCSLDKIEYVTTHSKLRKEAHCSLTISLVSGPKVCDTRALNEATRCLRQFLRPSLLNSAEVVSVM